MKQQQQQKENPLNGDSDAKTFGRAFKLNEAARNEAIRIHQAKLYETASHYISVGSNSNILSRPNGKLNAHTIASITPCIVHLTYHHKILLKRPTQRSQKEQEWSRLKKQNSTGTNRQTKQNRN